MEFAEVVRRRRMVRNYTDQPVEREVIERVVSVGLRGPSAGFAQGLYVVVVTEAPTRRAIAELADEDKYAALGLPRWISSAPVHIVVCDSEADYHARYNEPDKLEDGEEIDWPVPYWHIDAGAMMMLLLLAAVDEGLGAGFFGVRRLPGLKDLLGIPDEVTPIGVVTVGHQAGEQPKGSAARGRKAPASVIRWERWD
jgi:FMN reductase [NAD(P)H]